VSFETTQLRAAGEPAARVASALDPGALAADKGTVLICRTCGTGVSAASALLTSAQPLVFANPAGVVFEIVKLAWAQNVTELGQASAEHSWFAGYAWVVTICSSCRTHLGWHFSALALSARLPGFWGLLRAALAESPANM
jgi:cereblon